MKKIGIVLAVSIALIIVANSAVVAYSLQKGEEAGIVEYTNGQQVIGLQKTKMDIYTDSESEIKALSSVPTYYDNFTMLIGEKKCSSTYNPPIYASPVISAVYVYWDSYIYGCPKFIDFSSALDTYCLKILKPAELGTYKFQVEYYKVFNPGNITLRRKINITVNITECHNCSILTGVVTDFGGNPVSNAEIHVKNRDYESIDYHTNLTGFYSTCPLRNGTYTVSVSHPSDVNLLDKVVTANITKNTTLNITLQCGGILAGRVTYENGTGILNARVTVTGPSSRSAYTNTTGYYRIIKLLAGNYTVTAVPPSGVDLPSNFTNASVTLEETTFVDFVLHPSLLYVLVNESLDPVTSGGTTQVTVLVTTTEGTPLSDASVSVSATGGSLSPTSGTTDSKGEFKSTYTAPSVTTTQIYTISATASKAGYINGSGSDTITVNYEPRRLLTGTFIVKKLSGGRGELTIENGLSSDAIVVLSKSTRPKVALMSVYIQSENTYTITGIPDGVYILYYSFGEDWDSNSKKFTVTPTHGRFKGELEFKTTTTATHIDYTGYTATLHPVPGGTAKTEPVSEADFPE